jgi:hypothetical protein
LASLVRRIEIGDLTAVVDIHLALAAGAEFLLSRRLGKVDVSAEVEAVLDAAILAIRTGISSESLILERLVVSIIQHQFPSSARKTGAAGDGSQTEGIARSVIMDMPSVEQRIIRCYALGDAPNVIESRLHVSSREIMDTLGKARSMFFDRAKHYCQP